MTGLPMQVAIQEDLESRRMTGDSRGAVWFA